MPTPVGAYVTDFLMEGLDAAKPAAGNIGRYYWATDTKILYKDTGAAWIETARGETATRLAQLSEKSHASLSNVTASQHHTKYTDDNAVSAMGAKANDNPLHHDRTVKYTNDNAVAAMGAKADDNPLHHDMAAEWGATEHTAIGDAAPHHARYADAEADARVTALAILLSLLTTQGDIIVRGATAPERLAKITTGQILEATATGYQGVAKPVSASESWLHTELLEDEIIITERALVVDFLANAATGTFHSVGINDDSPDSPARSNAIDQYCEVDFGKPVLIKRWRHYGENSNNEDGSFKIQYYDLLNDAWTDWVTGIATRDTESWSDYVTETLKITTKIRLICTAVDSTGYSWIGQLEVIY